MDIVLKQTAAAPPNGDPLQFVMSDDSVDRLGDVIDQSGWKLGNFRKNSIALFGHDPGFPIGKWTDVKIDGNRLTGRLNLIEPVSDRMRELHAAVNAGVLRAVSVGFHATKYAPLEGSKTGGMRFTEQELVECSLVSVPANPNAIAIAKGLGISAQGQRLIFGVSADDGQAPPARGNIRGVSALTTPRKSQPMNTLSERIQTAQAELVGLQDRLGGTDDLDETKEFTDRIEAIKEQVAIYTRAEKALGSESEPIETPPVARTSIAPQQATRPKAWAMPKKKDETPGYLYIRHCVGVAVAHVTKKPLDQVMHERYGQYGDWDATKGVHEWYVRAATAPATSTTVGWAAELATTMYGDYIESLMPGGIYGPLSGRGFRTTLGRYAQISMPSRVATPTVAGSFVLEGAAIPVRQAAFAAVTLGLKKMAVIVSYTREIAEHSTPQIEQILRQLIQDDTQIAVDTVLIDATAVSATRPAGLRSGVAATTATAGGGFNALVGDIKALVGVLAAANSLRSPVWIMNPVQAISIGLTQNAGGAFPFQPEINNKTLQGFPVIVSSTVTAGMVILLDAADFMSVSGDDPRFDVSDQATLHFDDTTPLQISTTGSPNTVAAPVRSMFQTDSLALRMILPMNWAMRRAGVVAWTQAVTW
jgi:HK97 family phage prohead protease